MPDNSQENNPIQNEDSTNTGQPSLPGSVTEPSDSSNVNPEPEPIVSNPDSANESNILQKSEIDDEKPSLAITATAQPQKPSKIKKLLSATLILLILGSAGFTAWTFLNKKTDVNTNANIQEIQEIDSLTIGNTEGPATTFFPDDQLQGIYFGLNRQVYEGLVGLDERKITPLLAKSWTNPDDRTWIFTLQPNIKFHTGKAVTANEVKASLEDLKNYDYWSIFVSTIESVEVISDEQVKITTVEPDALLLNRLSLAFITDLTAPEEAGKNGTGAYMLDSNATNDEYNTSLVAFDDYYGGRAKTRKVNYKIYENDVAIIDALKKGEIDIAETQQVLSTKQSVEAEGFKTFEFEAPGAFGIYLNMVRSDDTILAKKEIRQAIAEAIDRKTIVTEVDQQHQPSTQVIPKSLPGYDSSIKMPEFNTEKAKDTLVKAGYKNEPLEFFYIKGIQAEAPIIISQLKEAGFNIKERVYEEPTIPDMVGELRSGRYDMFTASFSSDFIDARDLLGALLHSTESSYPSNKDETYDKLLEESDKAFDPAERIKKLQEANKYIADNLLWIPVRNSVYMASYKANLSFTVDYYGGNNLGVYFRNVGQINN